MAKISKTASQLVARFMVGEAFNETLSALANERATILYQAALANVPSDVLEAFNNPRLKPYFKIYGNVQFAHNWLWEDYNYHSFPTDCQVPSTTLGHPVVEVSKDNYERLMAIRNELDSLINKKHKLKHQIEAAILSIGTDKKLEADFPEAYAVYCQQIPSSKPIVPTAPNLAVPVADILTELRNINK